MRIEGGNVGVPVADPFPVFPLRLHLLDVGAVQEHDPQEIQRRRGHVDLAAKPVPDKPGEEPRVVHMGVGHQDEFNPVGIVDLDIPVSLIDLGIPLMHPAVDRKPMAAGLQDMTGAGDRPCRAHKPDFHGCLMISFLRLLIPQGLRNCNA